MPSTPQPHESSAIAFGISAVLLWSTVATGFKLGLGVLATDQLLLLGTAISWLVFLLAVVWRRSLAVSRNDFILAIGLGLINPWAYYLVLFAAYDRLPAHIAQPLNYTWAITLAILAVPILKQRLNGRTLVGIGTSYLGVVALLNLSSAAEHDSLDYFGVALALGSTVLWALYWLLNTRSQSDPASMMFVSFSVGLPIVFVTCMAGSGLPSVTGEAMIYGTWVGLVEMGVTFLLWQQALKRTRNTAKIGQLIFLSPFLSLFFIGWFIGEDISAGAVGSLALIVLGIGVANSAPRPSGQYT
jgi:drug/metabolite transporter (DMT)-like permease